MKEESFTEEFDFITVLGLLEKYGYDVDGFTSLLLGLSFIDTFVDSYQTEYEYVFVGGDDSKLIINKDDCDECVVYESDDGFVSVYDEFGFLVLE